MRWLERILREIGRSTRVVGASPTIGAQSCRRQAAPYRRHRLVGQTLSERRAAEGPAGERCHHCLSQLDGSKNLVDPICKFSETLGPRWLRRLSAESANQTNAWKTTFNVARLVPPVALSWEVLKRGAAADLPQDRAALFRPAVGHPDFALHGVRPHKKIYGTIEAWRNRPIEDHSRGVTLERGMLGRAGTYLSDPASSSLPIPRTLAPAQALGFGDTCTTQPACRGSAS